MRRQAALAGGLLALVVGLGASHGAAAPGPAERKPTPAASKGVVPAKSLGVASKPRVTKPVPRRGGEAGHHQVTPGNGSPALRPTTPAAGPPRPEHTVATSPAPRPEHTVAASPATRSSSEARIAAAREVYQAGRYAEVPTALIKLLTESQLTPAQLAAVYELLASAYVALGQTELAIRCFSEVLSRRPAFALDPVRTSPKIRAALDQAQAQARAVPGAPAALPTTRRPM